MPRLGTMALIGTIHLTWKRHLQAGMLRHGITLKHFYVLRQLDRRTFLNPSQIADMLFCDRPTATVAIDTMEKHGWVERLKDPENRKKVRVMLTEGGRAKLAEVQSAAKDAEGFDPLADLDAEERSQLDAVLRRIRVRLDTLAGSDASANGTMED